jgi:ribosomal RNA-processing protein 9
LDEMKKRGGLSKPSRAPLRGKKARGLDNPAPMNLKWKNNDEEISSGDDDDDDEPAPEMSSEEEDMIETAEEKRRRLAKGYLQQVSELVRDDEDSSDEEGLDAHLSERLKRERLQRKGNYYREFADHFEAMKVDDVSYRHLYGHSNAITCVALTKDESTIFTGSKDNSIIKWDTETGQKQELKRKWNKTDSKQSHEGEVLAVSVSHDGRYAVAGGKDCSIRIYDKRSKYAEVHVFKSHKEPVSGLAFQMGTYALLSASHDRCVKYWDLNEMAYIETLFGHQVRAI